MIMISDGRASEIERGNGFLLGPGHYLLAHRITGKNNFRAGKNSVLGKDTKIPTAYFDAC